MRIPPALALAGMLGTVVGVGACGDDPTVPGRTPRPSAARDIGDSTVVQGWAEDINASGHVAGWGMTTAHADGRYRPLVWSPAGEMTDLGLLPGTSGHASAGAINDRGEVVGISGKRPFLWTASGGMRDLGLPSGADHAIPLDLSEDGRVAGTWWDAGGTQHPFLWTPEGGMRELPVPSAMAWANAWGVNSRGQVVGTGCPAPCADESRSRALVWSPTGELLDLGLRLGVLASSAVDINDDGVVAGSLQRRVGGPWVAFTWSPAAGLRDLGTLPGKTGSRALEIGEGGHVVGASGGRPFDWTATEGMRDLGTLPGSPGALDAWASGVNRSGQAVGIIYTHQGPRPVLFVTSPGS